MLVPTTCFNCESACGLLAYVDKETLTVRKFEGNPEHPGSRGRNCAKGPATINQVTDPDRILYPLKRAGERGEGKWVRTTWDEALDDIAASHPDARSSKSAHNDVMYHVGRPGEDGYTERVLAAWGVDGHNSHTNICSSGGRVGYALWMGLDRPSADHANADVIFLISAHLESGHYFNPHAQRIVEGKHAGAKVIVVDVRLSNTATHADYWLAPRPGSEAAILLAIANHLIQTATLQPRVRPPLVELGRVPEREEAGRRLAVRGVREPSAGSVRGLHVRVRGGGVGCRRGHAPRGRGGRRGRRYAPLVAQLALRGSGEPRRLAGRALPLPAERAARRGRDRRRRLSERLEQVRPQADLHAAASEDVERPDVARASIRSRCTRCRSCCRTCLRRSAANSTSTSRASTIRSGRTPTASRGSRRFSDPAKVGLHVALTPTWSESAFFADYVLPMGLGSGTPRPPLVRDARRAVARISARACCEPRASGSARPPPTRATPIPGEVWEENEFWIELSWRIDPDGTLGIRQVLRIAQAARRATDRRRVLRLHLRELGAGSPRARAGGGLDAARVHAALRRLRGAPQDRAVARGPGRAGASWSTRASIASAAPTRAATSPRRRTSSRCPRRRATRRDGAPSECASTARSCAASRRRAASSSSTRRRSSSGAGRNTRCRRTSRATCTPTIWSRGRWC